MEDLQIITNDDMETLLEKFLYKKGITITDDAGLNIDWWYEHLDTADGYSVWTLYQFGHSPLLSEDVFMYESGARERLFDVLAEHDHITIYVPDEHEVLNMLDDFDTEFFELCQDEGIITIDDYEGNFNKNGDLIEPNESFNEWVWTKEKIKRDDKI